MSCHLQDQPHADQVAETKLQKGDVQNALDPRKSVTLPGWWPVLGTACALWDNAIPQRLYEALDENGLGKNRETVADYRRVPRCVRHADLSWTSDLRLPFPTPLGGGKTYWERSHPVE